MDEIRLFSWALDRYYVNSDNGTFLLQLYWTTILRTLRSFRLGKLTSIRVDNVRANSDKKEKKPTNKTNEIKLPRL